MRALVTIASALAVVAAASSQSIEIYRVQHRPAAELLSLARSTMGDQGRVDLDARTASLVLNGPREAIDRVLSLLHRLDRPLRAVVVRQTVLEERALDAVSASIQWKASIGELVLGTLPLTGPDGLTVRLGASRAAESRRSGTTLRLTEGGSGTLSTGTAFPVFFEPFWGAVEYGSVDSGFEVRASVSEAGDLVHLDLRPFAGRLDGRGGVRYVAASTTLSVGAGETVVVGESSARGASGESALDGVDRRAAEHRVVILLAVEVEP